MTIHYCYKTAAEELADDFDQELAGAIAGLGLEERIAQLAERAYRDGLQEAKLIVETTPHAEPWCNSEKTSEEAAAAVALACDVIAHTLRERIGNGER